MTLAQTSAEVFPPGEYLRDELEERGWTEAEFAQILGRPPQALSEILNGRKEITPETAVALGDALGTSPELWLNLQTAFRLHQLRDDRPAMTPVARRARLRSLVPVRELQKRGWLPATDDLDVLEESVCALLGVRAPDESPRFLAAARRSNAADSFTPEQTAWVARVRQLGEARVIKKFDRSKLEKFAVDLVRRIHDPLDLRQLRKWLGEIGIVLVILLPLKGSKIDGVVLFSKSGNPIIGLSTRWDRMDSLIFTLLHELAHLVRKHVSPGQVQVDEEIETNSSQGIEAEASHLAAGWVVRSGLQFGPSRPTMPQILAAARENGVHPSLIIGRLQRDGRLDWKDYRRSIPKVRPFVDVD